MLTEAQFAVLASAAGRILPSTDGVGAHEAHVIDYIRWAAGQTFFALHEPAIVYGIARLDEIAATQWRHPFCACGDDQQDRVLAVAAESDDRVLARFFRRLVSITLSGFLCDPTYGGNFRTQGWTYVGLEWKAAARSPIDSGVPTRDPSRTLLNR